MGGKTKMTTKEEKNIEKLLSLLSNILEKQEKTLNQVALDVVNSNKFRDEKSSLWEQIRNTNTEISNTNTRVNNIEYILKGDGLDKIGMYQTQENNFNTLFDKTKEQTGETKLLKEKHMAIESFCSSLGRRVGILEKKTDITENKISIFEEFLNKVNFLVGSIKILWIVFGAIITSAIPVIIKHIINLFQ